MSNNSIMNNFINDIAFKNCDELIRCISNKNLMRLEKEFGVSVEILKEIEETLNSVDANFSELKVSDRHMEVFQYANKRDYGIEANVFTLNGESTDLTLIVDLVLENNNEYIARYKLLEVQ